MPYGEKSAYAAQAALKKKSPAYMKSSGFKMKSPLFFGGMMNIASAANRAVTGATGRRVVMGPGRQLSGLGNRPTRPTRFTKRRVINR